MSWGWWNPGDDLPIVAVAVVRTGTRTSHVGIAYRMDDDSSRMGLIDLAFHCKLQVDDDFDMAGSGYLCLTPKLPKAMLEAVATRCRATAKHLPTLRYGFLDQRDAYLDQHGHYFVRDDRGQNCSSFVHMVFRSVRVFLVQADTWPHRQDDEYRFRELWCQLLGYVQRKYASDPAQRRIHEEFVRKIAPDVSAIRIRPEETAGSCLCPTLPVAFPECEGHGVTVLRRLGCPDE